MAVAGEKRVRVNTLEAVSDYVHAEDVARAILSLLNLERVRYSAYNIGTGHTTRLGELVQWAAERFPGFAGTVAQAKDLVGRYRDAGVQLLISSAWRNDFETQQLLAAEIIPAFA